jgi:hypothetical protein
MHRRSIDHASALDRSCIGARSIMRPRLIGHARAPNDARQFPWDDMRARLPADASAHDRSCARA